MSTDKTANGWTVLDRDAAVLTINYRFAGKATANAFAARMANGEMLVISPPAKPSEGVMADVAEFGNVGALVANNGYHYFGQRRWKEAFPDARCFADPNAAARIHKKNPTAPKFEPMTGLAELTGDDFVVRPAPGAKIGETWAWAKTDRGNIWFTSDLFNNLEQFAGNVLFRALWRLTKSGPGYRPFHLAMMVMLKNKKVALSAMLADVRANQPSAVVMSHGPMVDDPALVAKTETMLADVVE